MISRSMSKTLVIALAVGMTSASVQAKKPTTAPSLSLGTPVLGTGGTSTNGQFQLRSSAGQWEVNIVKLSATNGYGLEGGLWANVGTPPCGDSTPQWTRPYCH